MDDAEHSARLEGVMAGHESASQTLRDRRCDCAVEPRHQGGPDRRQVNALIRSQIAALTLTQIVVSGRRIRCSIGEQERTRSRTDKPWRERPCNFARGQVRASLPGSLTPWFVRCQDHKPRPRAAHCAARFTCRRPTHCLASQAVVARFAFANDLESTIFYSRQMSLQMRTTSNRKVVPEVVLCCCEI